MAVIPSPHCISISLRTRLSASRSRVSLPVRRSTCRRSTPMESSDAVQVAGNTKDVSKDLLIQYVVLRRDLIETWPLGSVVTQGCHASVAAIWSHKDDEHTIEYCSPANINFMHKVTLEVKGESQIRDLSEKLTAGGIAHKLWIEQPENIPSCLATKPYPKTIVSSFFKKLRLCMEQSGETKLQKKSKEKSKPRISWKNEVHLKTFLETCIQQVAEQGRVGGSLKPHSWEKVMKTLKDNHNFVVDQKQMKNHYDYLKAKYQAWCKLKDSAENVYDYSTNTFSLSEEEWGQWIKTNPRAESLKTSPLPFPDLCTKLFDGIPVASTNGGETKSRRPTIAARANGMEPEIREGVITQAQGSSDPSQNPSTPGTQSHASTPSFEGDGPESKKHGDSPSLKEHRPMKKSRNALKQSNGAHNLGDEMTNAFKFMVQKESGPSVQDCKEKLNGLKWGSQNSLHKMALGIFCESASYREAWMILDEDEIENWVLMVGRKLGYIV